MKLSFIFYFIDVVILMQETDYHYNQVYSLANCVCLTNYFKGENRILNCHIKRSELANDVMNCPCPCCRRKA